MSVLNQKTIKKKISFNGIGLHSGKKVIMTLFPAPPNSGIIFKRSDLQTNLIKEYLHSTFKTPYRARISVMHGGNELNYHIDTDTSVLCRVQIPVITEGSLFQWKTKKEQVDLDMKPGCAYFVNTGWLHRVINKSNNVRIVLIFGVDYANIPNKESITL